MQVPACSLPKSQGTGARGSGARPGSTVPCTGMHLSLLKSQGTYNRPREHGANPGSTVPCSGCTSLSLPKSHGTCARGRSMVHVQGARCHARACTSLCLSPKALTLEGARCHASACLFPSQSQVPCHLRSNKHGACPGSTVPGEGMYLSFQVPNRFVQPSSHSQWSQRSGCNAVETTPSHKDTLTRHASPTYY